MGFSMSALVWIRRVQFCLVLLLGLGLCRTAPGGDKLRVLTSRHYRIHTDLDEALANDLSRRMDAMYDEYARRLAIFAGEKEVPTLEAYLFRNQEDYLLFTDAKNTCGVFIPDRHLLAAFLEGQGRDALRQTLQHEAFHQFADAAITPNLPTWLNEGMAQVFEEGIWTGNEFWLGQVPPHRVRQLREDLNARRLFDFKKILVIPLPEWVAINEGSPARGGIEYNQSWAMVHFLIHAKDSRGKEMYRDLLLRMLQQMHAGEDAQGAFERSFGTNIKGFQARFGEYAMHLQATPEATLIENQGVIADLLIAIKGLGKSVDSIGPLRDFAMKTSQTLEYQTRELKWRSVPDLSVYFTDVDGKPFTDDALYLEKRRGAPLPDLVCRMMRKGQLRTRFFTENGKLHHELTIEPINSSARAANN